MKFKLILLIQAFLIVGCVIAEPEPEKRNHGIDAVLEIKKAAAKMDAFDLPNSKLSRGLPPLLATGNMGGNLHGWGSNIETLSMRIFGKGKKLEFNGKKMQLRGNKEQTWGKEMQAWGKEMQIWEKEREYKRRSKLNKLKNLSKKPKKRLRRSVKKLKTLTGSSTSISEKLKKFFGRRSPGRMLEKLGKKMQVSGKKMEKLGLGMHTRGRSLQRMAKQMKIWGMDIRKGKEKKL